MARDFVPALRDLGDERRVPVGDPTQYEKRGAAAGLIECIEEPVRAGFDPGRQRRPALAVEEVLEVRHVEVFLQVDAECIGDHV